MKMSSLKATADENSEKLFELFIEKFFSINNIIYLSLIYMEIFIDDNKQIIIRETENYEHLNSSGALEVFRMNNYFAIGDRQNIAISYNYDDQEICLYYKDGYDILIPDDPCFNFLLKHVDVSDMDVEHMFY